MKYMSERLQTEICGVKFKNPVIAASGTFGYGIEFSKFTDINMIGGVSVKGISLNPVNGNPMPRITETRAGMLNAIGLQNVGIEKFLTDKLPYLRKYNTNVIVNFWGRTSEEYVETAKLLDNENIEMLEMNISCPNVKEGGISFSADPECAADVVKAVRKVVKSKPLIVKLSPNVTDIKVFAKACRDAGADALSAVNTFIGAAIDAEKMKPVLANITGGLSGPAIKPLALRMVIETAKAVDIPIIGIGGITDCFDAAEFFLAGACAVQVGTANFIDPKACESIAYGLDEYLKRKNIANINDIIGKAVKN